MVKPTVIDLETEPVLQRPDYPPRPVGVAIDEPGRKPLYYAFGHPTGNNSTKEQAAKHLRAIYRSGAPLLFFHMKFDLDVIAEFFGLALPPWDRVHDAMFKLFLVDPHSPNLQLKPNCERLLGMKPEERDAVREWLIAQKLVRRNDQKWGRLIYKAPGDLVGRYAIGDVVRTRRLDEYLNKQMDEGLWRAYDRERKLMPILLANERAGHRVDVPLLRKEVKQYRNAMTASDAWIRKRLKTPNLNIDSGEELADALVRGKVVAEDDFVVTEAGNRSVSKKNLTVDLFKDAKVAAVYGYRQRLGTCLDTFMEHWLEQGQKTDGLIYTEWSQVRTARGGGGEGGARTGRMQNSPPLSNIPKDWYDKDDGYVYPIFLGVPDLPLVRQYLLPDPGHLFAHRDYSQQELRILAHFEDGELLAQYLANPNLDVHAYVKGILEEILQRELERRYVKTLNFGKVYGMGVTGFVEKTKCTDAEARLFIKAHAQALPGVKELEQKIRARAAAEEPIRTWGGRRYFCEPPSYSKRFKRVMTYEYKLLNYLIQGSAADCTKEAIIRLHEHPRWPQLARFLTSVHDEINSSVPPKAHKEALRIQREVMQSVEFDIPMLSDAKVGQRWGAAPKKVKARVFDTKLRQVELTIGVKGGLAKFEEPAFVAAA